MKNSLNMLLDEFPYFLDRSKDSNFYKSEWVFNEWFKEVYNDLFIAYCGHKLSKPLLLWKTQEADYDYSMNFAVLLDDLKTVIIYKNGVELYREDYLESESVSSFYYLHEDTSNNTIPDDSYMLYAESYNEYTLTKGFPENDDTEYITTNSTVNADGSMDLRIQTTAPQVEEILIQSDNEILDTFYDNVDETYHIESPNLYNTYYIHVSTGDALVSYQKRWCKQDSYNHDSSLDELGVQYSMPRKKYTYTHIAWQDSYYAKTEPPWNNRYTEDDYHYMNRMITYASLYHTTPLPVLELWKLFGVEATMENRNDLLCKMYEESLHDPEWKPDDDFSHKNLQYVESDDEDSLRLLYVSVDNSTPFEGTVVNFDLTVYNRYFDSISMTGVVEVYERDSEGLFTLKDTITSQPLNKWVYDTGESSSSVHAFLFKYYESVEEYNLGEVTAESDEIYIQIMGCADADIFVSPTGDDENNGSASAPVKTLERAMNLVEDSKDLVFLEKGEYQLSNTLPVFKSCTIAHCFKGSSNIISPRTEVFNISPNTILNLVNIDSWYNNGLYSATLDSHKNTSKTGLTYDVIINQENTRVPVVFTVATSKCRVGSECILKGILKTNTGSIVSDKEVTCYMDNNEYTVSTDSKGEFSINLGTLHDLGEITVTLSSDTDDTYKYCLSDAVILVKKYDTLLTGVPDKSPVTVGDSLSLIGVLVDEDNTPVEGVNIKDSTRGVVATTGVDGKWVYAKTATTSGTESFNLTALVDTDSYNPPATVSTEVVVNKQDTVLTVVSDKSNYKLGATATVTATLKTSTGTAISGASVVIDGSTVTTNSSGVASKTFNCTSTGSVSKTVTYSGNEKYNASTAKVTYVVTDKINTQMNIETTGSNYLNDVNIVEVTLFDSVNNTPMTGVSISDGSTSITTNSNGQALFSYTNTITGVITKTYTYNGDSEYASATGTATWMVYKRPVTVSLSTDKTSADLDTSISFTGTVKDTKTSTGIKGVTVEIVRNASIVGGSETVLATVTTDSNGAYSKSMTLPSAGDYEIMARVAETSTYTGGQSDNVNVTATLVATSITAITDKDSYYVGETTVVTATLKDNKGNALADLVVTDKMSVETTDSNGVVTFTYPHYSAGAYTVLIAFNGTDKYDSCSCKITFSAVKRNTSITATSDKSEYYSGETATVTVTLQDNRGTAISGATVSDGSTTKTTNSNGVATFTYSEVTIGTISKTYTYNGDSAYYNSSKTVTFTVRKHNTAMTLSTDKSSYNVGETVIISGVVTDTDYGTVPAGDIYLDSSFIATLDEEGKFTYTVTASANTSYTFQYKGNSTMGTCSSSVNVTVGSPELVLSGDSLIGESGDTLSLSLASNLTGGSVSLVDSDDGTVYASGTIGGDGSCTLSYPCTGLGDKNVCVQYINGTNISESNILTLEDCLFWDDCTSNRLTTDYSNPSDNIVYCTDEDTPSYKIQNTSYNVWLPIMLNQELSDDWIIEYDTRVSSTSNRYIYCLGLTATATDAYSKYSFVTFYGYNAGWGITCNRLSTSYQTIKVTKQGTTYKLYVDGEVYGTKTITNTNKHFRISSMTYAQPFYVWFKNLKVKPYSE